MKETVCQFGPDKGLFGILTTPADDVRVPGAPMAVIINAGIVHRVGPFRLHVDLARQLAEQGISTFRVDLSGLGDSQPRLEKLDGENRAILDVSDAINYLQDQEAANEFVLLGLCSGAYNAHQISVKDNRIVGAVFMDGIVFRTAGYYVRRFFGRFCRPRFYRNAIKRRWKNFRSNDQLKPNGDALGESEFFFTDDLDRDEIVKDLQMLLQRGVSMLFLYTDGYDDICGRSQFREMYGMRPNDQLQVEYYPKSEHTFRVVENRRIACRRIVDWYQNRFSDRKEVPPPAAPSDQLADSAAALCPTA